MKQTENYKIRFGESIISDIDFIEKREEFLKSKKVLSRFKKLEKNKGLGCSVIENARQLITTFNWENTLEGCSYWHKINTEWLEYIGIFGKYHTLSQYEIAVEKVAIFKSLLDEISEDGFSVFRSAFTLDNEGLELFIEDTLLRTFLGGYNNTEVLKLWLDDFHLTKSHWKNVLLTLKEIDKLVYEMNNDPKANARMLLACLCCSPQLKKKDVKIIYEN